MLHDAWHALFYNSFFWEMCGKHGLQLRKVCKSFRDQIPERLAIESAFWGVKIRKVDIFRLFPLSVYDVVMMRSPLLFVDAFNLALKKSRGFEFCIAVMREKGIILWNSKGLKRERMRSKLNSDLVAGGIPRGGYGRLFEAVVAGSRCVESAAVWYFDVIIHDTNLHPYLDPLAVVGELQLINQGEYDAILLRLRTAVGVWYKGINKDVREIISKIQAVRISCVNGDRMYCIHHHHVAEKKFLYGVIRFRNGPVY